VATTVILVAIAEDGLAIEGWLVVDMGAGGFGRAKSLRHEGLGWDDNAFRTLSG